MTVRTALVAITVTLGLAGCSDAPTFGDGPQPPAEVGETLVLGGANAPESTLEERGRALAEARLQVTAAAADAGSWHDLDARFRAMLDEATPVERWAILQIAAFEITTRHLLDGEPSAEKAEALAFYLPAIVEARSPELDVVSNALRAYAPYLDAGEVRSLARRAAAIGREHLARDCGEDCVADDPRLGERADLLAEQDIREARVAQAVVELEALAQR